VLTLFLVPDSLVANVLILIRV